MNELKDKLGNWVSKEKKEVYYKHLARPKDKWKVGKELKKLA
jgi:hypothetical protein